MEVKLFSPVSESVTVHHETLWDDRVDQWIELFLDNSCLRAVGLLLDSLQVLSFLSGALSGFLPQAIDINVARIDTRSLGGVSVVI